MHGPKKQVIVDKLLQEHYSDRAERQRSLQRGEKLYCGYPAAYVMTQTVKMYKALMIDPQKKVKDKDGKEVVAPAAELLSDHTNVIPARYSCVQCQETFDSLGNFEAHIRFSEQQRMANAKQESLVK